MTSPKTVALTDAYALLTAAGKVRAAHDELDALYAKRAGVNAEIELASARGLAAAEAYRDAQTKLLGSDPVNMQRFYM